MPLKLLDINKRYQYHTFILTKFLNSTMFKKKYFWNKKNSSCDHISLKGILVCLCLIYVFYETSTALYHFEIKEYY